MPNFVVITFMLMIYHESFVCHMAKHTRAKNCLVKLDKRTSLKQSFFRKYECVLLRIQWFSMELPTHCKATTVIHKKFPSLFCYTSNLPFVYWWKLFTSKLWPAKIVAIILCHHKNPNYDRRWPITITCKGSYHLL